MSTYTCHPYDTYTQGTLTFYNISTYTCHPYDTYTQGTLTFYNISTYTCHPYDTYTQGTLTFYNISTYTCIPYDTYTQGTLTLYKKGLNYIHIYKMTIQCKRATQKSIKRGIIKVHSKEAKRARKSVYCYCKHTKQQRPILLQDAPTTRNNVQYYCKTPQRRETTSNTTARRLNDAKQRPILLQDAPTTRNNVQYYCKDSKEQQQSTFGPAFAITHRAAVVFYPSKQTNKKGFHSLQKQYEVKQKTIGENTRAAVVFHPLKQTNKRVSTAFKNNLKLSTNQSLTDILNISRSHLNLK
jgi:hypothetical protein